MSTNNTDISVKARDMSALAAYEDSLFQNPRLRFLFLELTDRCNLHCLHCGSSCSGSGASFLALPAIGQLLRRVAERYDPAQIMICLTGGEPLLHPHLLDAVYLAHRLGFSVGMTTNGTRIDAAMARELARAGLDTVTVSLDGLKQSHEALRRRPGCYEQALSGIRALQEAGLQPEVLTVVHKGNLAELEELYRLLLQQRIGFWRLVSMDPIGRAREQEDLLLGGAELRRLLEYIRAKRYDPDCPLEVSYGCAHFAGPLFERDIRDYYFQCGAGTLVASVMADGSIGACLDIERRPELIQGNIYRDDFIEIWEQRFKAFRRNRAGESETCKECHFQQVCRGDSAHTWDYDRREPRYCALKLMEEKYV